MLSALIIFIAVVLSAAGVALVRYVHVYRALPFFKLTQDWSIATFLSDRFPPEGLLPAPRRPALTRRHIRDISAEFIADPFLLKEGDRFFLFAEVLNGKNNLGEIGYAESADGLQWEWKGTVLREDFHLSYPHVFREGPDIYMIPETGSQKAVYLYQAVSFPTKWRRVATLLEGLPFNDASIFRRDGLWWMFAGIHPYVDDILCLFHSEHLRGPWQAHPMNPIISGHPDGARPGGRVTEADGKLYRFGQDCWPYYGLDLRLYEISELTPQRYSERLVSKSLFLKKPKAPSWMAHGQHQMDALKLEEGRWLIAMDGCRWRWRFGLKKSMTGQALRALWAGLRKRKGIPEKPPRSLKTERPRRSQVLKNIGSNYLLTFVGMTLGFFLVPFLIRKIGQEAYGIVVLAESAVMFFDMVTMSIRVALSRYATVASAEENTEDFVRYLSTGRVVMYFSAAIILVTGVYVSVHFQQFFKVTPEFSEGSRRLFFLIMLGVASSIPNTIYWTALYAKQRFELINFANSCGVVLRAVLLFVLFSVLPQNWRNIELYGLVYLGMMLMQNTMIRIFHYVVLPGMRYPLKKFQKSKVREILSYGVHTSIARVSGLLYSDTANIIIINFWGATYNAIFSVATKIPSMMGRIFIEPSWVLTTTFTNLVARGERGKMEELFFLYSKLLCIVTFPICFSLMFYGKELIALWVGPDFSMAGDLSPIFIGQLFMVIPFSLAPCLFNAYGKVKVPSLVSLWAGVLNVVLCLFFGVWLHWKLFGIAVAAVICATMISKMFTIYYACRISGVSYRRYWFEVLIKPMSISGLLMVGAYRLILLLQPAGGLTALAFFTLMITALIFYWLGYHLVFSERERGYVNETAVSMWKKALVLFKGNVA